MHNTSPNRILNNHSARILFEILSAQHILVPLLAHCTQGRVSLQGCTFTCYVASGLGGCGHGPSPRWPMSPFNPYFQQVVLQANLPYWSPFSLPCVPLFVHNCCAGAGFCTVGAPHPNWQCLKVERQQIASVLCSPKNPVLRSRPMNKMLHVLYS